MDNIDRQRTTDSKTRMQRDNKLSKGRKPKSQMDGWGTEWVDG